MELLDQREEFRPPVVFKIDGVEQGLPAVHFEPSPERLRVGAVDAEPRVHRSLNRPYGPPHAFNLVLHQRGTVDVNQIRPGVDLSTRQVDDCVRVSPLQQRLDLLSGGVDQLSNDQRLSSLPSRAGLGPSPRKCVTQEQLFLASSGTGGMSTSSRSFSLPACLERR